MKKLTLLVLTLLLVAGAHASERYFTYSYSPETLPARALEFEQTADWGGFRSKQVGQDDYQEWHWREELEYGVTDRYTASIYLNTAAESYHDPATGKNHSSFTYDGVSLENRYMLLNPAEHAVGLTLYIEPTYAGKEAELEEKIILGQNIGDWKWALNITQATEWKDNFHESEAEFAVSLGLTRHLGNRWSLGIEALNHNEIPEYNDWENTAFFVGPVVTYVRANWWATLTVLPQVWGRGTSGGPDADGVSGLELEGHERINVRLMFGIAFE